MKIDIEKLESYLDENYVDPESPEGKHRNLIGQKNPLIDFVRSITGRKAFNPIKAQDPLKHPKFKELEENLNISKYEDFISYLNYYIEQKGMTHPQVYNAAGMTADCFSKIISGKTKTPKKESVIALALALKLDYPEAINLLSSAGFSLSFFKQDLIYEFCFKNGPYTIDEVNEVLVYFHFQPIGGRN